MNVTERRAYFAKQNAEFNQRLRAMNQFKGPMLPALQGPEVWENNIIQHMTYVYSLQTNDEQADQTTKHKNKRGFSAVDATICCSIIQYVLRNEKISEKQYTLLCQKAKKYSKQLPDEDWDAFEYREEWLEANPELKIERTQEEELAEYSFHE